MASWLHSKGEEVNFGAKWLWSTMKARSGPGGLGDRTRVDMWLAESVWLALGLVKGLSKSH